MYIVQRQEVLVTGPFVLVADNDCAVSSLLRDVLLRMGLSVRQAFDGESARDAAGSPDVAVLVCDLDMPRMSGVEVLESLAAMASPPPVVVISGYLDPAIQVRLKGLGFVREVLRKPFDLLGFAEKVRALAVAGKPAEWGGHGLSSGAGGAVAAAAGD